MEANVSVQANNLAATNLRRGPDVERPAAAARAQATERPAALNRSTAADLQPTSGRPAQEAPPVAPPIGNLPSNPNGVNILSAHPTVTANVTADLIAMDIPLPFGESEITENVISRYISSVNEALAPSFFRLNFNVHEATNRVMVTVYDTNTDEVLREIPPESRLDVLARMQEFVGLLFDDIG